VFITRAQDVETFWVVTRREVDRMPYCRLTPGSSEGIVSIRCRDAAGGTDVEVVYGLFTPLIR
jgi:hypothetical protein